MRLPLAAATLLSTWTVAPAAAQSVLDWPIVLEARPAPLVTGSGAILTNPAGIVLVAERAEALVSDLETPDAMGLRAVTIAGAVRVFDRWTIGGGYRHIGVGDMLRTDGPPLGGGLSPLEIGEDVFALGLGVRLGAVAVGAAARLDTPAAELQGDPFWAGTLGARYAPVLPLGTLLLAASLEVEEGQPALAAAVEVATHPILDNRIEMALAWGIEQNGPLGLGYSIVGSGTWRDVVEVQAGTAAQPGAADSQWVPLLAGLLNLGRYRVGIVREHLPNDFGAAMHYRLSIAF